MQLPLALLVLIGCVSAVTATAVPALTHASTVAADGVPNTAARQSSLLLLRDHPGWDGSAGKDAPSIPMPLPDERRASVVPAQLASAADASPNDVFDLVPSLLSESATATPPEFPPTS